jgi:putative transposase
MPRSRCEIWIHAVWAVKNREPLLHDKFRRKLFAHIYKRFRESPVIVTAVGGVSDHVHCLFSISPTYCISKAMKSKAMKDIKGESSRLINSCLWVEGTFFWQEGYGAFSVSPSQLSRVRNYIFRQEQYHATKSFDEEIKLFDSLQQRGNSFPR